MLHSPAALHALTRTVPNLFRARATDGLAPPQGDGATPPTHRPSKKASQPVARPATPTRPEPASGASGRRPGHPGGVSPAELELYERESRVVPGSTPFVDKEQRSLVFRDRSAASLQPSDAGAGGPAYGAVASEVTMSSFVLSTIATSSPRSRSGTRNFASVWWKSSMNASHSSPVMNSSRCVSSIVRPE
jgi:hypothetical protein